MQQYAICECRISCLFRYFFVTVLGILFKNLYVGFCWNFVIHLGTWPYRPTVANLARLSCYVQCLLSVSGCYENYEFMQQQRSQADVVCTLAVHCAMSLHAPASLDSRKLSFVAISIQANKCFRRLV